MSALLQTYDLFGNRVLSQVATEGIKYAGSKLKLLPHILTLAAQVEARSVLDAFSGTTRVSQAFAQNRYSVTSSDISAWSETFAKCYLLGKRPESYQKLIDHLNSIPPKDGWFSEHYGGCQNAQSITKRPWQYHNTRKLDGIRSEIDHLGLEEVEKDVALTSLIQALDRVDSTVGHFSSYLKNWSNRSKNHLHLRVPQIVEKPNGIDHQVYRGDVFDIVRKVRSDLTYLDPPYGSNNEKMPPSRVRYASYYHLWTTVILNDEPEVFGAANRRVDSRDEVSASVFEEFRRNEDGRFIAIAAIEKLLQEVQSKFIVLSYSSGGRATADDLRRAISTVGKVIAVKEVDYKRNVMARMRWTDEWIPDIEARNIEYLFLIEKGLTY